MHHPFLEKKGIKIPWLQNQGGNDTICLSGAYVSCRFGMLVSYVLPALQGAYFIFCSIIIQQFSDCAFNGDNTLCPMCRSRVQDGLSKQKEQ